MVEKNKKYFELELRVAPFSGKGGLDPISEKVNLGEAPLRAEQIAAMMTGALPKEEGDIEKSWRSLRLGVRLGPIKGGKARAESSFRYCSALDLPQAASDMAKNLCEAFREQGEQDPQEIIDELIENIKSAKAAVLSSLEVGKGLNVVRGACPPSSVPTVPSTISGERIMAQLDAAGMGKPVLDLLRRHDRLDEVLEALGIEKIKP